MTIASNFDPTAFLDAVQTTEAGSTVSIPVPVGEYTAVISGVKARPWQSRDGTKSGLALDVTYDIDSPEVKQLLGRPKVTITQGIMLDMTEQGGLDFGKGRNITLNRLRDAVGLNQAGQPFSFRMLEGKVAKIAVSHTPNEQQPGAVYSNVSAVTKA